MPSCCSTEPAGIRPAANSRCQTTSASCTCRPIRLNSIRSKTSGSSCDRTNSATASSTATPISSMPAAMPGTHLPPTQAASVQSPPGHGHRLLSDAVGITPNSVPQQLDGALAAIWTQHAGSAQFEKSQGAVPIDQLRQPIFAGGIKSAATFRNVLPQQPARRDCDIRRASCGRLVEYQQMIADGIKLIEVSLRDQADKDGRSGHLLVEDLVSESLRATYLGGACGQSNLERTEPAERCRPFGRPALALDPTESADSR